MCDERISEIRAERDRLRQELEQIREMVGGLDGETTVSAVQDVVTEWEHYSREMNKAGYVTIPGLQDRVVALTARLQEQEAATETLARVVEQAVDWIELPIQAYSVKWGVDWQYDADPAPHWTALRAAFDAWRALGVREGGERGRESRETRIEDHGGRPGDR